MHPLRDGDPDRIGPYRLEGRLGVGGMGEVFLGVSPGGRRVAVKVIRAEHLSSPKFRVRFAREVEAARKVGGFYTAQVVDADPEAGEPWMATAYIPGPSLREAAPLDVPGVRALGAALAEGLEAIHAGGLVHRDLKPGNVIMSEDGPRIIDFGIARAAEATALTSTGAVVGTYAFMSPEQVRADTAGPASDVFSLGCVLAFAATGRGPFDADNVPRIVHRIASGSPDLTGVPAELRPAIEACLAKDPDQRPAPAEVARLLAAPPARPRRRTVLIGGAAGAAAVLGVPSLVWWLSGDAAGESTTPMKKPQPVVLAGGPTAVFKLAFTPDSATLVCAGDEQIWRWSVATDRGTAHDLGEDGADQGTALSGDGPAGGDHALEEAGQAVGHGHRHPHPDGHTRAHAFDEGVQPGRPDARHRRRRRHRALGHRDRPPHRRVRSADRSTPPPDLRRRRASGSRSSGSAASSRFTTCGRTGTSRTPCASPSAWSSCSHRTGGPRRPTSTRSRGGRSGSSTCDPGSRGTWKDTRAMCRGWRSAPTAAFWPARPRTRRSGCGTSAPARPSRPWTGRGRTGAPWRSARTAACSPPGRAATTEPSASGAFPSAEMSEPRRTVAA
ncbi:serine/threonine protein kinase [Actinomadura madurae]|nr:serine/threonine-protein kinase [Actinomadura madurae]MCP9966127.1 serine/threonine protein kinase [Actinomadura madurae]